MRHFEVIGVEVNQFFHHHVHDYLLSLLTGDFEYGTALRVRERERERETDRQTDRQSRRQTVGG